jgi:hypothetical protein
MLSPTRDCERNSAASHATRNIKAYNATRKFIQDAVPTLLGAKIAITEQAALTSKMELLRCSYCCFQYAKPTTDSTAIKSVQPTTSAQIRSKLVNDRRKESS